MRETGGTTTGSSDAPAVGPETGRRRSDPRLRAYLVAGFGGLAAAIATGQPELAALGAPFIVLAAIGLIDRGAAGVRGGVRVDRARVIEGDVVEGEVRVDWDGEAEVDLLLAGWRGVAPIDPEPVVGWSLPAGRGPVTLPFRLRARSWGVHDLGTLWVRVRRPGGLRAWERDLAPAPSVRVLPAPLRLDSLLKPSEPRVVAGVHLSRSRGHGTDFADLRPYQPGDRLRDLSWSASARFAEPWVTVHHPERTGTVLLLLDAFFTKERKSTEALARAARAAWAVASLHLKAQDRVGLLAYGRTVAWFAPQGGRRARWLLLDELLSVGGAAEDLDRRRRRSRRVVVPSDALIVGVTNLRSQTFRRDLLHHRRTGHTTVALVIDTSDLLPDADSRAEDAARRLWLAQREAERQSLERGGVPTARVTATDGVGPAISSLRRRIEHLRPTGAGMAVR